MSKIDLTLHRIRRLAALLPSYTRPTCHIAGTNGKGSVSALLSSILLASQPPLKVGRFNSPHLISIHDSIVINDKPVAPDLYSAVRSEVEGMNKSHDIGASSFEILTLTALLAFERVGVDIVVAEVGMGGRLDATNIIPDKCILVSALTSVDLDHQAFLGSTVGQIAREKAGIARIGKPIVVGRQKYPEVDEVVRLVVAEQGGHVVPISSLVEADGPMSFAASLPESNFHIPLPLPVRIAMPCFPEEINTFLPLHGKHQLENLATATTMVSTLLSQSWCIGTPSINLRERITPKSISQGIQSTIWPGRLSFHKVRIPQQSGIKSPAPLSSKPFVVLVDGAHNSASISSLSAFISNLVAQNNVLGEGGVNSPISMTYILALSDSPPKTPLQTLMPLLSPSNLSDIRMTTNVAAVNFTPPNGMRWIKSVAPSELRRVILAILSGANVWIPNDNTDAGPDTLRRAFEWATAGRKEEHLVIVTGSLYLVADFYRLLRDGDLLSAESAIGFSS